MNALKVLQSQLKSLVASRANFLRFQYKSFGSLSYNHLDKYPELKRTSGKIWALSISADIQGLSSKYQKVKCLVNREASCSSQFNEASIDELHFSDLVSSLPNYHHSIRKYSSHDSAETTSEETLRYLQHFFDTCRGWLIYN